MFNWLKNIFSFFQRKKKVLKPGTKKWKKIAQKKRDRTAYNKQYNERDYVKLKKKSLLKE